MGSLRRTVARGSLTARERGVVEQCRTPGRAQRWIRSLAYNWEARGRTMRTFRGVVRFGEAHCLEAALAAAAVLEHHGYAPLLLDLESQDRLDHVVFAFRFKGCWGAVGASRDVGLWGRRAAYRSVRDLANSYYEPYIDLTARITGYALADLRELGAYDWRLAEHNVWKVERWLISLPHRRLRTDDARYRRLRRRYRDYLDTNPASGTPFTRDRHRWM